MCSLQAKPDLSSPCDSRMPASLKAISSSTALDFEDFSLKALCRQGTKTGGHGYPAIARSPFRANEVRPPCLTRDPPRETQAGSGEYRCSTVPATATFTAASLSPKTRPLVFCSVGLMAHRELSRVLCASSLVAANKSGRRTA